MTSNLDRRLTPQEAATTAKAARLAVTCREGGVYLAWLDDREHGATWKAHVLAATPKADGSTWPSASRATWQAVGIILQALEPKLAERPPLSAGTTLEPA